MAIQIQGNGGVVADVGGSIFRALNINVKPLDYGTLGHYRFAARIATTTAQAANARVFTIRNPSSSVLVIPTRLTLRASQTAAGTAQENSLDLFKVTSYTVVDTTNTSTPTVSVKRGATMAATPTANVRILAAAAAGMTGGTLTKDSTAIATLPYNVAAAINTTTIWGPLDCFDDVNGTHPLVLAQNEGLELENRVLNATSYGITWYLDFCWAEVSAF